MTRKAIIIATQNKGKIREIKKLLRSLPVSIATLNDFSSVPKIIENGKTFAENAKKIISAGVIGLVIIFVSFALASFVINQLLSATGAVTV